MMPTMAERITQVLLSDHPQVLNETSKSKITNLEISSTQTEILICIHVIKSQSHIIWPTFKDSVIPVIGINTLIIYNNSYITHK